LSKATAASPADPQPVNVMWRRPARVKRKGAFNGRNLHGVAAMTQLSSRVCKALGSVSGISGR